MHSGKIPGEICLKTFAAVIAFSGLILMETYLISQWNNMSDNYHFFIWLCLQCTQQRFSITFGNYNSTECLFVKWNCRNERKLILFTFDIYIIWNIIHVLITEVAIPVWKKTHATCTIGTNKHEWLAVHVQFGVDMLVLLLFTPSAREDKIACVDA